MNERQKEIKEMFSVVDRISEIGKDHSGFEKFEDETHESNWLVGFNVGYITAQLEDENEGFHSFNSPSGDSDIGFEDGYRKGRDVYIFNKGNE